MFTWQLCFIFRVTELEYLSRDDIFCLVIWLFSVITSKFEDSQTAIKFDKTTTRI